MRVRDVNKTVMDGAIFSLTKNGVTNVFRSYIYQGRTYVKYVRSNASELHLGRIVPNTIALNKKYQSSRMFHILKIKEFITALKRSDLPTLSSYVFRRLDQTETSAVYEEAWEQQDERDYLYRIGMK